MFLLLCQAAQIPCSSDSITEMIKLMDANRDGCIGWDEFESFMMEEFACGKRLLSGEYVLPSGNKCMQDWTMGAALHNPVMQASLASLRL